MSVYPGYMGIDKRGVPRGKCTECECEEFESVNSIACEYCGHPPVKHENQREDLSPPAKKRLVSVSNNISLPLCDSAQVTSDSSTPALDLSIAVIESNGAVSGLLKQGCDSAHTISNSLVPAGLSEEVCDSSNSASNPEVAISDSTAGLSDEVCDSSNSASDTEVAISDSTASVSHPLTISQTSLEYPLAAKNVVSFLKKISKEEGDLSTSVSRYQLTITEEGKLKVTCKVCRKDVSAGDTKHSRVQNLKVHLDSREHQLQLAILENEQNHPASITVSFREIEQAFPRMFLLTHKGAFCRVCGNTTISLAGQRNPLGNAKQHVESKAHKAKMQGSSTVSSKDISSYFRAPTQKK